MDRPPETFSFGPFEVRTRSREMYKHGVKLKLRPQPFLILSELLSRPGELVTREELREKLWSSETFVDFEQSLNTSVKELRAVLGDSATEPLYVETVPRLGYRFIGTASVLERAPHNGDSVLPTTTSASAVEKSVTKPPRGKRWTRLLLGVAVPAAVLLAALVVLRWLSSPALPKVLRITQLTHNGHVSAWGKIITDGARIFFLRKEVDGSSLMQLPVAGGEPQPFSSPLRNARILDVSPDRSEFLVEPFTDYGWDMEFWTLPVVGGSPRRLSDLTGNDAAFSPDGQKIAYSKVNGIYICNRNGSDAHKIVSLPSVSLGLAWSPNGAALRFTLQDPKNLNSSLWEVSSDGSNLHALLPGWNPGSHECCGQWSSDGRYFFFLSAKGEPLTGGLGNVWALREKGRIPYWSRPGAPVRLTTGPLSFGYLYPSADGRRLFTAALAYEQMELLRGTEDKKQLLPIIKGLDVHAASLSPRGDWLAVVLGGWTLWRSRPDGSERTQLAAQFPGWIDKPKWSPDGKRIVFQGNEEGRPPNIYVVSAEGGPPQELMPNDRNHESPDWSPDGESVLYVTPWFRKEDPAEESGIFVLNFKTRKPTRLPESEGMTDPRFSLDGRYLAAFSKDYKKVMAFNFQTREWKEIASGKLLNHLDRAPNADYFYFQDVSEKGEPIYRVRPEVWKLERVMSFESFPETGIVKHRLIGILGDGSPMVLAFRGGYDIYALDLDLP